MGTDRHSRRTSVANHSSKAIKLTLKQAKFVDYSDTAFDYSFYTIVATGVRWDNTVTEDKYPYIIDTGTTLIYLPPRKCHWACCSVIA